MRRWWAGVAAVAAFCALGCGRGREPAEESSSNGLVFVRVVNGATDIARARITDGAIRAVTETTARSERWPYWSDAAQRLVFQVSPGTDVVHFSDLVLYDPVTEQETPLFETPGREERWPDWSPDGTFIAYAFRGGTPPAGVGVTKPAPGSATIVAGSEADELFLRPSFSPNGRRLVVQRRAPEFGGSKIWILKPGAPPRALTSAPEWIDTKPFFSRDGTRIIYTRRPAETRRYEIASIPVAGGPPRTLLSGDGDAHSARPSPTRDELAYVLERAGASDVFLADLDGGNRRALRETPDWNELAPRWSPDGERVVVTTVPTDVAGFGSMSSKALERSRVVVLDRNGRTLLDTPGAMADWMPPWR